jgi:hypothetical protein
MARNLYLTDAGRTRHEIVFGKSGSGKTEYMKLRIARQMAAGGFMLIVDAKPSQDFRDWLSSIAWAYGRSGALRVIDLQHPDRGHTYNPVDRGDGETIAGRIAQIFGTVQASGSSEEHFKQMFLNPLQLTVDCLRRLGLAFHIYDLYVALTNVQAMEWLLQATPDGEARRNYAAQLASYRTPVRVGGRETWRLDERRMGQQFFNTAQRLMPYGTGNLGRVMRVYSPEVDLLRAIDESQVVYVPLPTLERSESAYAAARMLLSDLKAAIAALYARGEATRPAVPGLVFCDEFASWAVEGAEELIEKARGANIGMVLLMQTAAGLAARGPEFAARIIGSCETRTFLTLGDPESCELAARICGEALRRFRTEGETVTQGASNRFLDVELFHGVSRARGRTAGSTERYDYVVRPEAFARLGIGEAWVVPMAARQVFRVRFPRVHPGERRPFRKVRYETPARTGAQFGERFGGQRGAADGVAA